MCRMMGAVGRMPGEEMIEAFRALSLDGNVLPGGSGGHGDGWGLMAWRDGGVTTFAKSGLPADSDPAFSEAVEAARAREPDLAIVHLRKASVGAVNGANAHPFRVGVIGFCHNGGIKRSSELDTCGLQPGGDTDSERFFLNVVGRLKSGEAGTLKDAARAAVSWVHRNLPYTSLSFLMSDGRSLLAYRDYRAHLMPDETEPPEGWEAWDGYYTLYYAPAFGVVSSEPLTTKRTDWQLMENGEMLELRPGGFMGRIMMKMDGQPLARG
jgi:glutamine amidotransferase